MEGEGTPKNEQNQFCHSPAVKAMTPSEVERQDSHAAGVVGACLEVYYRTDRPRTLFMTLGVGVRGEWGARHDKTGTARREGKKANTT